MNIDRCLDISRVTTSLDPSFVLNNAGFTGGVGVQLVVGSFWFEVSSIPTMLRAFKAVACAI